MKWFEGSIAQAVTASKKLNAVFVVYIEGKDDLSATLASALETPIITGSLDTESFVNVRLEKDSQSHTQFSEIYKLVPVPSVFFIGQNGAPVEVVVGDSSQQNVISKLTAAIHKCDVPASVKPKLVEPDSAQPSTSQPVEALPETSVKPSDVSPVNPIMEEQKIEKVTESVPTKAPENMEIDKEPELEVPPVVLDNKVEEKAPLGNESGGNGLSGSLTSPPPLEERIERAKELLEKKKEEKRKQDEKEERERELERRRIGQELLEAKKKQHERELKELKEERLREKQADHEAKQRVLDQIAQDKAERLARMMTTAPAPSAEPTAPPQAQPQQPRPPTHDTNTARIQFKLPDGQTRMHIFPSDTTISQVRQFIDNNIELPFREYQMATTFPRREFTFRDNDSDLRSLELTPTAVILIMPVQGNMSVTRSGGWSSMFTGLLWDLVQPFLTLSRYLQSLVWGAPPRPVPPESRPPNSTASSAQPQRSRYSPPQPQSRAGVRKRGNIHSLADSDGSNDENNTWNGNSTQQM